MCIPLERVLDIRKITSPVLYTIQPQMSSASGFFRLSPAVTYLFLMDLSTWNLVVISKILVYNTLTRKEGDNVAAVKVKPIQPTVISDISIIKEVISEATAEPSPVALELNKEAIKLLRCLQAKKVSNEA